MISCHEKSASSHSALPCAAACPVLPGDESMAICLLFYNLAPANVLRKEKFSLIVFGRSFSFFQPVAAKRLLES